MLVPFNASGMVDYHDKYIGDSTFYTTELGSALSRCAHSGSKNGARYDYAIFSNGGLL